jgi:hypothetical protein
VPRTTPLAFLALAACAAPESEPLPPTPGFTVGPEVVCADPVEGWDRFEEVGRERGLTEPMDDPVEVIGHPIWGRGGGIVVTDLDGDGDADVLAARLSGSPDVYLNDGRGWFERAIGAVPPLPAPWSLALGVADADGDGRPELFLSSQAALWMARNRGDGTFDPYTSLVPEGAMPPGAIGLTVAFGDVDGDGDLDVAYPTVQGGLDAPMGGPDLVLANPGGGDGPWPVAFELISAGTGSTTQVAAFTDRDGDGDQDLFVPNDLGPRSAFWRNDGDALIDDAAAIGADLDMAAMGIDNADVDGDGRLDYCMTDVGPPICLLADGAGGFVRAGAGLGLLPADPLPAFPNTVGWGFDLADLDSDGHLDAVQASAPCAGAAAQGMLEIPDVLWAGTADGGFADATAEAGLGDVGPNTGLATADLDGDGYLDLVIGGPDRPPRLYRNRCGAGAWLEVELTGPPDNPHGLGARVVATVDGRDRPRELWALRGQGQGPARVHFGLGDRDEIDALTVRWPDGKVSRTQDVPTRRRIVVDHATSEDAAWSPAEPGEPPTPDGEALEPGDDEIVVQGAVVAAAPGADPAGRSVWSSHRPEVVRLTDGSGRYELVVPEDGDVDVTVEGEGLVDHVVAIQSAWQRGLSSGLVHALFTPDVLGTVHGELYGLPPTPGRGWVWVQVGGPDGAPVAGTRVELSAPHDGAVAFGGGDPVPGDRIQAGRQNLGFANVPAGPLSITVTPPDGETCRGRAEVEVPPDALLQVTWSCS